jgi:uncharacterized delta-60 repeat protein
VPDRPRLGSRLLLGAAAILAGALAGRPARAADGDLDPAFWGDGKMNFSSVYDGAFRVGGVLAAPDGALVVVASRRRNPDPDALFWQRVGASSLSTLCNFEPPGGATSVVTTWPATGTFDAAGRLVVAGTVEYGSFNYVAAVARFLYPACVLDSSFDGDGYAVFDVTPGDEFAIGIDVDLAGRIYVAGAKGLSDADQDMLLMRLEPDGDLDPTYSGNGWLTLDSLGLSRGDMARTVEVQADGRPVFAGHAEGTTPGTDFVVVRTTLSGALDTGFAGDGVAQVSFDLGGFYDSVYDLAFDFGSGRLAVVGAADAPSVRRAAVAVLSPNGALDPTFSGDGKTTFLLEGTDHSNLTAAEWDGLGRLVAAAIVYDGANGPWDFGAVRLQANGSFDASFGPNGSVVVPFDLAGSGGNDGAWALALQAGRPLLAGDVQHSDDAFRPALVRLRTALIFADGFDTGTTLGWLGWY